MKHGERLAYWPLRNRMQALGPNAKMPVSVGSNIEQVSIGRPGSSLAVYDFDPCALGDGNFTEGRDVRALAITDIHKAEPAIIRRKSVSGDPVTGCEQVGLPTRRLCLPKTPSVLQSFLQRPCNNVGFFADGAAKKWPLTGQLPSTEWCV
jgi:hypothetical protein